MFSYIKKLCFFDIYQQKQLKLEDFQEFRFILDDTYNKVTNGNIWLCYFDKNKQIDKITEINNMDKKLIKDRDDVEQIAHKSIGYVSYKNKTGQIGLFFINKDYQNLGLGKQILLNIINELTIDNKTKEIWAITTQSHPFWSNVFEQSFEFATRPHNSVTGSGYLLNLNKFNKYKNEYNL
jgi:hypothetical protein